jgi:Methyltransferase domain
MIRYGKSNAEYMKQKAIFYDLDANRSWVARAKEIGIIYCEQPKRTGCVVCGTKFAKPLFVLHGAAYSLCERCGHFNGHHQDTPDFARRLYATGMNEGAGVYADADKDAFLKRVRSIYVPKAEFMRDALTELGEDPARLRYADLGAGAGHYVMAMRELGYGDVTGYEVSGEMVARGNAMFGEEVISRNAIADLPAIARGVDADVITMIFSLEHIEGLRDFVRAVTENPRLRYFYFAVPTVSPSLALESLFPNVMPRILGFGHTHLFSDASIDLLCRDFRLRRAAEWWFGSNAFDLHRYLATQLASDATLAPMAEAWGEMLLPMIDELQLVFDRHKMSSEVHLFTALER